ncbi:insulin-like receptor [Cydia amplana]|uniref:insulin-like receptor n=1 Tax=Cydia amplana TaxID=1869771 RepID=UPI002FE64A25
MAAKAVIGFILLRAISAQVLYNVTAPGNGICGTIHCRTLPCLRSIDSCVTVVGNFTFIYFGRPEEAIFDNITFWNLKEITGYMAIYMVPELDSIGQLFPSLTRIRGRDLLHDYALIIYDMNQLTQINLYSLLKIDRGGVIIWGGPNTCYVDTVDWKRIAPRYRHVLSSTSNKIACKNICTCTDDARFNKCWNNKKCQRYIEGPEAMTCHEQCLGCRLSDPKECTLCRYYTYEKQCVSKCPNNTIILEENQYCITEEECLSLKRWVWNNSCVITCPDDYIKKNVTTDKVTCEHCSTCKEYCGNITIESLGSIQAAHRCVYINGSLTIHIRAVSEALEEMKIHLSKIQEVDDYIAIHDSFSLARIDFLPSLKRIHGKILKDNKYSLLIRDNPNLQTIFLPNVTEKLQIDKGSISILRNPMLCMSELDKIKKTFPQLFNGTEDKPYGYGLNAYSGCEEVPLGVIVKQVNQTSAIVKFRPMFNTNMHYTILYVRIPAGESTSVVPEICSKYEWRAIKPPDNTYRVQLTNLRPASTYLVCIESYDLEEKHLKRSSIVKFTTAVGKPEPPFLMELVADNPHLVVLHWADHIDYLPHITRYELSVALVEIYPEDVTARNQCEHLDDVLEEVDEIWQHAVVMRPPPNYGKGCESMCGVLSSTPHGALVEEDFDICSSMGSACDEVEELPVTNISLGFFVRTLSLNISAPRNAYQVGDLAPYRDYRFRLRACTKDFCSRSTRGVVRTLPSKNADVPSISTTELIKPGLISVSWTAPEVSNGPVLAYFLKIMPDKNVSDLGTLQTQRWCVPANQTTVVIQFEKDENYTVQICSLTLASQSGCTGRKKVSGREYLLEFTSSFHSSDLTWAGVFFAVCLCIMSVLVGFLWATCRVRSSDSLPLVDITSSYRTESEPPIFSLLDFTPSLHVSRTDIIDR